jgi:type VI secretion system secreted protein Hcp
LLAHQQPGDEDMLTRVTARTKAALVVGTFAVAAYAAPAMAATTSHALLNFDGITGGSTLKNYKGAIEIDNYSWGVASTGSSVSGSSGGKPIFADFAWEQVADLSTPYLFDAIGTGLFFKTATLSLVAAGASSPRYFSITFSDALLSTFSLTGTSSSALDVKASFSYDKVALSFWPQNADGSFGAPITASYDLKAGSGSTSAVASLFARGLLASPSPVPEPETYAMLLAGLGLLGAIARRRMIGKQA